MSIPSTAEYMAARRLLHARKVVWNVRIHRTRLYAKYAAVGFLLVLSAFLLGRITAPEAHTIVVPTSGSTVLSCEGADLGDAVDSNADGFIDCGSDKELGA